MAEYHGDIMDKMGTIHRGRDNQNYVIAIVLLLIFGQWGVHRFYLGDHQIGWVYLTCFVAALFVTTITGDRDYLLFESLVIGAILLMELVYFLYKLFGRRTV
jgi:TM2 domain-containing membrane protein YozV